MIYLKNHVIESLYIYISFVLGSVISYVTYDKNVNRQLKEYSARLSILIDKLEADLAERNAQNNHRSLRGKSKTI